jgi:thiamine pyrophosphate-dependent acetolactate synthase large subunit-like protein
MSVTAAKSIDSNTEAERELTDGFNLMIDALKLNGLTTIYGVPGIPITDFGRMAQAAGIRVISFRHEQNAGNAASIAGYLTKKPGVCLTVSAPGFLNGLTALAHATTNCFPMILISGSSEREIVDLQQGDYEEMDQLAIAKPLCKAAFRVLHAADIGIGLARAIRAAVSGRPGGVYLDLPAKLFGQVMDAEAGKKSLVKVIDAAPAQIPAPSAVKRALDVLKSAKRPLIILGKGAAYAQADDTIKNFVEKSGIPFLPMSMAKGLLPDLHPQCAGAARSTVLKDADVVMLIGARLNWLLSHGKGKAWGDAPKKIHPDRHRAEGNGLQRRDRRPRGWRHRFLRFRPARKHGQQLDRCPGRLDGHRSQEARRERRQDGAAAHEQQFADGLSRRARRTAHDHQGTARRHPRQRGRQHARPRPRRHRHVPAAQADRCRHLGRDGHRHGLLHRRCD